MVRESKQLQKCVALLIFRIMHFHGFGSSGDAKNIPTEGFLCLFVCCSFIFQLFFLSFLVSPKQLQRVSSLEELNVSGLKDVKKRSFHIGSMKVCKD